MSLVAERSRLGVGYVALSAAADRAAWSGLNYRIGATIEDHVGTVRWVGPLKERHAPYFKARQLLSMLLLGRRRLRDREPLVLRAYARQVANRLSTARVDLVFSSSTLPITHLRCEAPIFFWTDATFAAMCGFYLDSTTVTAKCLRDGNAAERAALERCTLAIYSSEWAAKSAVMDYGIDPNKVKVVPFGANIESRRSYGDVRAAIGRRPSSRCRLLFVGLDWVRKGGDTAVAIAQRLNDEGLSAELTIVGCRPARRILPDFVNVIGFLDKHTESGRNALEALYARSHFLLLPSHAEAYGLVLAEACAYGVPCIASNVGGIPTIVRKGVNGMTFDPTEIGPACSYIEELMANRSRYEQLAASSFAEYEARLNWDVAGRVVKGLIDERL